MSSEDADGVRMMCEASLNWFGDFMTGFGVRFYALEVTVFESDEEEFEIN
jgi:hypothetical protein